MFPRRAGLPIGAFVADLFGRSGRSWSLPQSAVRHRRDRPPRPGRSLSKLIVWAIHAIEQRRQLNAWIRMMGQLA
jgi:hypothetical protein